MLRISCISTLLFYLTVTIGIHVNVDTCCKAIAEISISPVEESSCAMEVSCCAEDMSTCCEDSGRTECSLTSLFLQFLAEEQVQMTYRQVAPVEIEYFLLDSTDPLQLYAEAPMTPSVSEPPPNRPVHKDIYIQHRSLITYG